MNLLLAIAVLSPVIGATLVLAVNERLYRVVVSTSLGVSLIALVTQPVSFGPWREDRLGWVVAAASLAIATWTILFAARQFAGEARARRILSRSLALVASVVSTDVARTPLALLASWVAVSVLTVLLLQASERTNGVASRASLRFFGVGDGLLVATVLLCLTGSTHGALTAAFTHSVQGWRSLAILAAGSIAAAARAGLTRRGSWVVATINAPTSTSALLHAGVVNAGAILLWRLHTIAGDSVVLSVLLALYCLFVLVRLVPTIHARVDLKGQLASSTVAQMAFMLLALSLGFPLLAITHLIGHGIYKAARFMGAGGAIEQRAMLRRRSERGQQVGLVVRLAGAIGLVVSCVLLGSGQPSEQLAVAGLFGVAAAAMWWLRTSRPLEGAWLLWGLLVAVVALYSLMVSLIALAVGPVAWVSGVRAPWWTLAVVSVSLAGWSSLRRRRTHRTLAAAPTALSPRVAPSAVAA